MARRGWYPYNRPKLGEAFASFRSRSSTLSLSTRRRPVLRLSWIRQAYGAGNHEGTEQVDMGRAPVSHGPEPECRDGQNLILPIMPAMFVVSSLIVGAIEEAAR